MQSIKQDTLKQSYAPEQHEPANIFQTDLTNLTTKLVKHAESLIFIAKEFSIKIQILQNHYYQY